MMADRGGHGERGQSDWAALIGQMARADEMALTRFYDETSRFVYGLVLRIARDPAAAEEVTLDVYCQAWTQASAYSPARGTPRTWLFTLARSRALDHLRSRIRRDQGREQALDAAAAVADAGRGPDEATTLAERGRLVRNVLASLPAEQRETIELAYFEGLSQSEIAARTGQPLGSVKTRVRLGMLRLRQLLQPFAKEL